MINIITSSYSVILGGLGQTLFYFIITLISSSLLGVLVTYLYSFKKLKPFISAYISVVRGTPLLLQLAFVLGFSKSFTYYKVLLPLAVRNSFPSLSNEVLVLLKDTALIYTLGLSELIKVSRTLANIYVSAVPFILVGMIYFILSIIIEKSLKRMEKRIRKVTI